MSIELPFLELSFINSTILPSLSTLAVAVVMLPLSSILFCRRCPNSLAVAFPHNQLAHIRGAIIVCLFFITLVSTCSGSVRRLVWPCSSWSWLLSPIGILFGKLVARI
jgi:hypothetical protein